MELERRSEGMFLNGKKVENALFAGVLNVAGSAIVGIGYLFVAAGYILQAFATIVLAALSPIWLLIHFVLRSRGRKGFVTQGPSGTVFIFDSSSFRKVGE